MSSSFDFVVIGGGTSGLVVAARLSEVHQFRILVLEAGGDHTNDPRVKIPAMWASLFGSEADWCFNTVPQVSILLSVPRYMASANIALKYLYFQTPTDSFKRQV